MSESLPQPIRLGLTGGIGSGKSTVARMFSDLGAGIIDADAISRETTASGGAAIEPIRQAFGNAFIDSHGALDRSRMREHCFANPSERKRLEAIIHPLVQDRTARMAAEFASEGRRLIVFDIPLLVESGHWRHQLDRVLVIDCSPATQIRRVIERSRQSGQPMTEQAVQAIIDAQAPRALRLACADCVICNEWLSLEDLRGEVQRLLELPGLFRPPTQTGLSSAL